MGQADDSSERQCFDWCYSGNDATKIISKIIIVINIIIYIIIIEHKYPVWFSAD
jgi:hypothetical protein